MLQWWREIPALKSFRFERQRGAKAPHFHGCFRRLFLWLSPAAVSFPTCGMPPSTNPQNSVAE
jgi:hypothetical protein